MSTGQTHRSRAIQSSARQPHYVYRCYDAEGVLLYVGCAANVKRRIAQHRKGNARAGRTLAALMVRYEIEGPFGDREAAQAIERGAIWVEDPLLNIQHGRLPGWLNDARLAEYLAERDLPLEVGGLHRCADCGMLRGYHMTPGDCGWCRDERENAA